MQNSIICHSLSFVICNVTFFFQLKNVLFIINRNVIAFARYMTRIKSVNFLKKYTRSQICLKSSSNTL